MTTKTLLWAIAGLGVAMIAIGIFYFATTPITQVPSTEDNTVATTTGATTSSLLPNDSTTSSDSNSPQSPSPTQNGTDDTSTSGGTSQPTGSLFTHVKIALLDVEGTTSGPSRGCDKLVMVDRTISPTDSPLTAALNELFSINESKVGGWYNFIAKTNGTLKFQNVTLTNGTARIYLTGSLSGLGGECDDPRAKIQIEETAKQFPTVKNVEIYLNGTKTDLQPSER